MAAAESTQQRLLSVPKAAQYLSLSPRTLRSLVAAGRIPHIRVSPGRIAFDRADLDAYINKQRR